MPKALRETSTPPGRGADPGLGEVLDFMRLLWSIDHGLQTNSKRMEVTLGITGLQRMVLRLVGRFPAIAAGTLAQLLHVHPSTLTGVLKRLEEKGMVTRGQDPLDGRRALFTLTSRGRGLDTPRTGTVEAAVERALQRTSRAKIESAREVLRTLSAELSLDGAAPAVRTVSRRRRI